LITLLKRKFKRPSVWREVGRSASSFGSWATLQIGKPLGDRGRQRKLEVGYSLWGE